MYIQSKGDNDSQQIAEVIERYLAQARTRPELSKITSTYNASAQVLRLDVDREKAETLGVAVEEVYSTMQTMFGSMFVSQFSKFSRLFQVIIQGEPASRLTPKDIDYVYVRSQSGSMVPLNAVATMHFDKGPDVVTRFNNFTAIKVTADAAPGFSSGEAINAMEETAAQILPSDYGIAWSGQTFEEKKAGGSPSLCSCSALSWCSSSLRRNTRSGHCPLVCCPRFRSRCLARCLPSSCAASAMIFTSRSG